MPNAMGLKTLLGGLQMIDYEIQEAIKKLSIDADYGQGLNENPGKLKRDFDLNEDQMRALEFIETISINTDVRPTAVCCCCFAPEKN